MRVLLFVCVAMVCMSCSNVTSVSVDHKKPYVQQPVAFLGLASSDPLTQKAWEPALLAMEKKLEPFASFLSFDSRAELKAQRSPRSRQNARLFGSTVALTDIANRDLSIKLAKGWGIQQFLIAYVDRYTCTEQCKEAYNIWMRLQLVDALTGDMIWKGHIQLPISEESIEEGKYLDQVTELSEEMIDQFLAEFKIPWHERRFQNLQQPSSHE